MIIWQMRSAYLKLVLVQPIFILSPTSVEKDCFTDIIALLSLLSALLDEASEWCNTGTGANHDDWLARIRR